MADGETDNVGGLLKGGAHRKWVIAIAVAVVGVIALLAIRGRLGATASTVAAPGTTGTVPAGSGQISTPSSIDPGQLSNVIGTMSSQYQSYLSNQSAFDTWLSQTLSPAAGSSSAPAAIGKVTGKGYAYTEMGNMVPLYGQPSQDISRPLEHQAVSFAAPNTQFDVIGNPISGKWGSDYASFYPVNFNNQTLYLSSGNAGNYLANPTPPRVVTPPPAVGGGTNPPTAAGQPPLTMMSSTPGGPPVLSQMGSSAPMFGTYMPWFMPLFSEQQVAGGSA